MKFHNEFAVLMKIKNPRTLKNIAKAVKKVLSIKREEWIKERKLGDIVTFKYKKTQVTGCIYGRANTSVFVVVAKIYNKKYRCTKYKKFPDEIEFIRNVKPKIVGQNGRASEIILGTSKRRGSVRNHWVEGQVYFTYHPQRRSRKERVMDKRYLQALEILCGMEQ